MCSGNIPAGRVPNAACSESPIKAVSADLPEASATRAADNLNVGGRGRGHGETTGGRNAAQLAVLLIEPLVTGHVHPSATGPALGSQAWHSPRLYASG